MSKILITDSLFIGPAEENQIKEAGYTPDRLDKPCATEDELVAAIKNKVGYILGGVETVTERVIDAAENLKAIAFTGSGYSEYIPGWERATSRGIAISAATGGNAESVAEFALISALSLVRNLPALTAAGGPSFYEAREFGGLTLGIVGFGHIGQALAKKAVALGVTVLATPSSTSEAAGPEVTIQPLEVVLSSSDVVSVHVDKERGNDVLNADAIALLRDGTALVNAAFESAIDNAALLKRVAAGELRAALDYAIEAGDLPIGSLVCSNAQTAFNTREANTRISARATGSLLRLLRDEDDSDLVNPDYRKYRSNDV